MGQLNPEAQRALNERYGMGRQPAPAQPQQQDPIVRPADPYRARNQELEEEANSRAARNFQEGLENTDFSQVGQLRGEFRKLASFSEYTTALGTLNSALSTEPSAQGDQSLITSYAKMLDPNSAVREGEFDTTAGTENRFNQLRARIAREFGVEGGGMLSEDGRRRIRSEMRNLVEQRFRPAYERDRADYIGFAQQYGYDPMLVVGTDPFTTYEARFSEYFNADGAGGQGAAFVPSTGQGGAQQPTEPELQNMTMRDMYPQGAELGMDTWGRDAPFDAMQYLQETYGISASDERRLVGALNSRMGDNSFSADDVRRIYGALEMPLPDGAGIEQIVNDVHAGTPFGGIDTSEAQREYEQMLDARNQGTRRENYGAEALADQGALMGMGDEISGVLGAANAAMRLENPIPAYRAERDSQRRALEQAREREGTSGTIAEIAGGVFTGGVRAAPQALRATNPVRAAVREGAILGGAAGFGYGEGPVGSAAGAATGAALGGVTGGALQAAAPIGRRVLNRVRGPRPDASDVEPVLEAGARRGVTVRRADVDPAARRTRADTMQTQGRTAIREAEAEDLAQMEDALLRDLSAETADGPGETFGRGERIQAGVRNVTERIRRKAGRLYDKARSESRGVVVEPRTALRVVNEQIAELEAGGSNSNRAAIEFLDGLRKDLTKQGGVGIDLLRGQRTNLRGNISANNLSMTDTERRVSLVLDALSEDIKIALQGNPALGNFRRADELWRQQAEFQQAIGRKLVGTDANPVSAEVAARRVQSFIGSDFARAKRFIDDLGPDARRAIREQVAVSLGRNRKGEFSIADFLTHTGDGTGGLLPRRSQRLLFGQDGMDAIADLRVLAAAKRDAADPSNTSNTGGVLRTVGSGLRSLILGASGFGIVIDAGGGMGAGTAAAGGAALAGELWERLGQQRAMRLLLTPDFTRWLRSLPNSNQPQVIDNAFDRLRRTASRNSVFVADVQALERALIGAANDNAGKVSGVAADEQPEQQD